MTIEISTTWSGATKGWHIYMGNEQVYFTKDDYEKSMFVAELKARIKIIQNKQVE